MASASETQVYSLLGDVGGTNARFQLVTYNRLDDTPTEVKTKFYRTKDHKALDECIADFVAELKGTEKYPQNAVIAVAGAVFEGKCQISNLEWPVIDEKELEKNFQIQPVALINDFVSIGYAMIKITDKDLVTIHEAKKSVESAMIVAGPGTGLGECVLQPSKSHDGKVSFNIYGTEGGHKNFAPTTALEWEYQEFYLDQNPDVKEKFGYVSSERAFCGLGVPTIYKFFCKKEGVQDEGLTSEQIIQNGLNKTCKVCVKALEFLVTLYAKEVSNFALSSLPYGGIYLVGGLTDCILDYILKGENDPFKTNYFSKGKVMNGLLNKFPVYFVKRAELGLLGSFVRAQKDAFKL